MSRPRLPSTEVMRMRNEGYEREYMEQFIKNVLEKDPKVYTRDKWTPEEEEEFQIYIEEKYMEYYGDHGNNSGYNSGGSRRMKRSKTNRKSRKVNKTRRKSRKVNKTRRKGRKANRRN